MLKQVTEGIVDDEDTVYIRYRLDGSLFNLRRLQAHTKTREQLIRYLLFTDDAALVAHSERALQCLTSCFTEAAQLFGLQVGLKKTEVLHQPAPREVYYPPHITIGEDVLKPVHQFTYLGCAITSDAKIDREVDNRLAKANSAFGRLYKRVWNSRRLKNVTKISVYRAVVLTTLLYGCESWVTYHHHLWLLERFHQRCLCIILKIHWSNFVTNVEVLQLAEITSIEAMLLKSQFRWAGHISRMKDQRLPKIALYSELSTGHRDRGEPKKRYKDHLKKLLDNCHIDHYQWPILAADHEAWCGIIHQAVSSFEGTRRATLKDKCLRRKNRKTSAAAATNSNHTFICRRCSRTCLFRIGLFSHQRVCSWRGSASFLDHHSRS